MTGSTDSDDSVHLERGDLNGDTEVLTGPAGLVVSVQDATAPDAVTGHLAWGVLIDAALVAVPGPLDWLLDGAAPRLEVLIADVAPGRPGLVERIRPERIDLWGLAGHATEAVALVRLGRPWPEQPEVGTVDPDLFHGNLDPSQPDVWTALEIAGAVPLGIREWSPREVLGLVMEWERWEREHLIRDTLVEPHGPVSTYQPRICVCCIWRGCSRRSSNAASAGSQRQA